MKKWLPAVTLALLLGAAGAVQAIQTEVREVWLAWEDAPAAAAKANGVLCQVKMDFRRDVAAMAKANPPEVWGNPSCYYHLFMLRDFEDADFAAVSARREYYIQAGPYERTQAFVFAKATGEPVGLATFAARQGVGAEVLWQRLLAQLAKMEIPYDRNLAARLWDDGKYTNFTTGDGCTVTVFFPRGSMAPPSLGEISVPLDIREKPFF